MIRRPPCATLQMDAAFVGALEDAVDVLGFEDRIVELLEHRRLPVVDLDG